MSFGKQLQIARKQAGLTQKELGEKIGVSKSAITSWETDARQPDIPTIKKLTESLGVSAEDLLEIKKAPPLDDTSEEAIERMMDFIQQGLVAGGFLCDGEDLDERYVRILVSVIRAMFDD